jgi:hypothetical protein
VRHNANIGLRDLVEGFLFSLRAEGKSNGTIDYYTYLLYPLLFYAGEQGWSDSALSLDTRRQGSPFDVECNTNLIERFHGTIKSRTKVMRGLHTVESARLFMDGWLVHYNFFRPHMSLKDRTPASVAGIRFPFRNWKDIIEQPYEKTARIPIKPVSEVELLPKRRAVKVSKTKKVRISPRKPRITPPMPLISEVRTKR